MNKIISTFFSYGKKPSQSEVELLEVFIKHILDIDSKIKVIITTDPLCAPFIAHLKADLNIREINREHLLLDRCRSNLELLKKNIGIEQIIFADYDIIFNKLISTDKNESLLLTVRNWSKFPINGGVLAFCHPSSSSISLYESVKEIYEQCSQEELPWWGDQVSLYKALAEYHEDILNCRPFNYLEMIVKPVEVDKCNWTPFDLDVSPQTLWRNFFLSEENIVEFDRHDVIHFKGPRKHLMMQYVRSKYGNDTKNITGWIENIEVENVSSTIKKLHKKIDSNFLENNSIWKLADDIFTLLPLLSHENSCPIDLKNEIIRLIQNLSKVHSDSRFKLLL